ncbi:hypothetical protein AYO50_01785 [Acidobacteria bacterium SCGC AG-212-P17]|nr:hypothetical protein AYO50_01785 [Acidobacteria bacterium SCGC AG-212-P17]
MVRAIAGHVSQKAMSYYSHIRIEAKKVPLDLLVPIAKPKSARKGAALPLLSQLRRKANQLGIPADAGISRTYRLLNKEFSGLPAVWWILAIDIGI